jgi:beta-lactamase class D
LRSIKTHSIHCLQLFIISIVSFILLAGCVGSSSTPFPSPVSTASPASEDKLEKYFQSFSGAFVLYDQNNDRYIRYNPERCSERFLPASTFKILNSLIGLETGVIPDENYVIKWDGTQYENSAWNQDHTLKTAFQNSVVWYYQELARRVGREKMQYYVDAVGYGNKDITGRIDSFWLDGALRISADEQVELLKRLYRDDLPFSQRSMKIVKEIMVLENTDTYRLSGKTGSGQVNASSIGWFVGYVEEKDNVYFFATNIESSSPDANGIKAKEITRDLLQGLELLP